jgi:hypothetical protein
MKIGTLLRVAFVASMLIGVPTAVAEPPESPIEPPASTASANPRTSAPDPIDRIAAIGASASAGFGVFYRTADDPESAPRGISLAKLYRAASGDSTVVIDLGTAAFFSNPSGIGTRVVDRTIRARPDLTFAIDYLFWFTYGTIGVESRRIRTDEDRMALLEVGLEQLDRIEGPILVGDIPDMSSAAGGVMMKSQVAPENVRLRANERIREWASSRPNVRVFPLADLIERLRSGEAFNIGPHAWTAAEAGTLILGDRLHPSLDGLIALVIAIDDLLANDPDLATIRPEVDTDRARLKRRLTGAKAETATTD